MKKAPEHPRQHALTIAAAQHLNSCGHLSDEECARIHGDARSKLAKHKASKAKVNRAPVGAPRVKAPPAPPFGSIAPSGHYMSTMTPPGDES